MRLAGLAIATAAVLLTSCDDIEYKASQYWNKGTQAAVSECVEYNRGRGSSLDLILRKCKEKHEESVQAKFSVQNIILTTIEGTRHVEFWFKNTSDDMVLTEFGIQLIQAKKGSRDFTCFFETAHVEPGKTFNGVCSKNVLGGIPRKIDDYLLFVTRSKGVRAKVL